MAAEQSGKARINFSKAEGYKLVPVTGAWGGVSPQREIIIDFYIDQRSNPTYLDIEVEDGQAVEKKREPDPQPIERLIQFGVAVRPDIARIIGKFLIDKADQAFGEPDE